MNPICRIRRIAGALAGLAFACLVLAVAAPAAFARSSRPLWRSWRVTAGAAAPVQVHTVIVSGMPGLADRPDRRGGSAGRGHHRGAVGPGAHRPPQAARQRHLSHERQSAGPGRLRPAPPAHRFASPDRPTPHCWRYFKPPVAARQAMGRGRLTEVVLSATS